VASEVTFTEFVVTRVLHTARISNVKSTVCDNKERKMVNFKLGRKWDRWNIQFVTSVGQRRGHGFDSCRGRRFFLCPTLVTNWIFHLSYIMAGYMFCKKTLNAIWV